MTLEACELVTDRLDIVGWHAAASDGVDLPTVVADLLTPAVTAALPDGWQGRFSTERARSWIAERDAEGITLLARARDGGDAVGLVILFESAAEDGSDGVDVRLGYLLGESWWGRGIAGEILDAFVAWCRAASPVRRIVAGVEDDNAASIRVLERAGFTRDDAPGPVGQRTYFLETATT